MATKKRADLGDPRVHYAYRTCARCPEEYVGRLVDGRWFYFAYRWGRAVVGVGVTVEDAIDERDQGRDHGGVLDGEWPDQDSRNTAFRDLLTDALARTPEPARNPPCPACDSSNVEAHDGQAVCLDCRYQYLADS